MKVQFTCTKVNNKSQNFDDESVSLLATVNTHKRVLIIDIKESIIISMNAISVFYLSLVAKTETPKNLCFPKGGESESSRRISSSLKNKNLPVIFWISSFSKLLLLLGSWLTVVHASYVVTIPAKDEQCYLIGGASGTLSGNFDHLDDDISSEPLTVVIVDDKEQHVLFRSRRRASEGMFRVNLKNDQKVNLCLQNGIVTAGRGKKSPTARAHDGLERTVGFEYTFDVKDEKKEIHSQNEKNVNVATELTTQLNNLMTHHQYMKIREAKHREVVETTFSQLMWWVLLEGIFVVVIAAGQVMYFQRFLERRRYL